LRAFLIIAPLFIFFTVQAQQNNITSVTASYDPAAIAELYDHVPIGLEFKYANGEVKKTEGFLGGAYRWRNIKVTSSCGTVQNGYLQIDRQRLAKQQYKVELTVTLPETTQPLNTTLTIPHLENIRFNHYADSLKRGIRFYLNVEGSFSSGKVYPLDTAAIKFSTSAGKLLGQDLLLNSNDASTRSITVKATNKRDSSMTISSTIPVKQLLDK
jgi:hypothetical protein